jgi:hypothetical protein
MSDIVVALTDSTGIFWTFLLTGVVLCALRMGPWKRKDDQQQRSENLADISFQGRPHSPSDSSWTSEVSPRPPVLPMDDFRADIGELLTQYGWAGLEQRGTRTLIGVDPTGVTCRVICDNTSPESYEVDGLVHQIAVHRDEYEERRLLIVSTSDFDKRSVKLAASTKVELVSGRDLAKLSGSNNLPRD